MRLVYKWEKEEPSSAGQTSWVNYTEKEEVLSQGQNGMGVFEFSSVKTLGLYGKEYYFKFVVNDPHYSIESKTFGPIPLAMCEEGSFGFPQTSQCHKCPQNAECSRSEVQVMNGNWRPSAISFSFYPCMDSDSCTNGTCGAGYMGPRCGVCAPGYGRTANTCAKCPETYLNYLALGFLILLGSLVIYALIYSSASSAGGTRDHLPILIKMATNHLQVSSQMGGFGTKFPALLHSIFQFQSSASGVVSPNVGALDCEFGLSYYGKFWMMMSLPIVILSILAVSLFVHFIMVSFKQWRHARRNYQGGEVVASREEQVARDIELTGLDPSKGEYNRSRGIRKFRQAVRKVISKLREAKYSDDDFYNNLKASLNSRYYKYIESNKRVKLYLMSIMVVLFLVYPTLVRECVKLFQCEDFDFGHDTDHQTVRKTFLIADLSINCASGQYKDYKVYAAAFVAFYGVGIPLFSCFLVKLVAWISADMRAACNTFSFATGGYRPSLWFWESTIMIRKLVMIVIMLFIQDPTLQTYAAMWFITFTLVTNYFLKPYSSEWLSKLEAASLSVLAVTLNIALMFNHIDETSVLYHVLMLVLLIINVFIMVVFLLFICTAILGRIRRAAQSREAMLFPYLKKHKFLVTFLDMEERFEFLLKKETAKLGLEQGSVVHISHTKVCRKFLEREGEFKKDSRRSSVSSLRRASQTSTLIEMETLEKDFAGVDEQVTMPSLSLEEQIKIQRQLRDDALQRLQDTKGDQTREMSLRSEAEKNRETAKVHHNSLTETQDKLNCIFVGMVNLELFPDSDHDDV